MPGKLLTLVFWRVYAPAAMALGFGSLAILCASWFPFASLLHLVLPRRWGVPAGRFAIHVGARFYLGFLQRLCGCRFDFSELRGLQRDTPVIIAANHPSLLDAVLVVSQFPDAVCIMKASLMDNFLFGGAARLAGYIRNQSPLELLLRSCEELRQNAQLVIFPEGTRTGQFPVNPVLPGTGLISMRSGLPVQTLLIEFSSPYLGKDWPLFLSPPLPLTCRVRLGRRFEPALDVMAFSQELETYFRSALTWPLPTTGLNAKPLVADRSYD